MCLCIEFVYLFIRIVQFVLVPGREKKSSRKFNKDMNISYCQGKKGMVVVILIGLFYTDLVIFLMFFSNVLMTPFEVKGKSARKR